MTISVTHSTAADGTFSTEGAAAWDAGHVVSGLGTMAEQNANSVAITGGDINNAKIGQVTPETASFTSTHINGTGTYWIGSGSRDGIGRPDNSGVQIITGDVVRFSSTDPSIARDIAYMDNYGSLGLGTNVVNPFGVPYRALAMDADNGSVIDMRDGGVTQMLIAATDGHAAIASSTDLSLVTAGDSRLQFNADGSWLVGASVGTAGQVLTSNGTGAEPSWQSNAGGDVVGPASSTDNAIVRFDATTGKLIQNSTVTIDDAGNIISPDSIQFSGTVPATQPIGTLWFDSSTDTLNLQQNNITQQVGEEIYVYGKASNTISGQTLLQAVVKTGVVGASGVIQFGVAGAGVTDAGTFIGVATEDIANNAFGRITSFGVVHGINTTGSTYGETWVDGQDIWYNPTTGGLTKTKPVAPNIKVQLGTVINAGSGGSGSFQVLIGTGSSLGGTDDNVQITTPASGNLLTYNGTYWYNASSVNGGTF